MRRAQAALPILLLTLLAGAATGCGAGPATPPGTPGTAAPVAAGPLVRLDFDEGMLHSSGSADVTVEVSTAGGGEAVLEPDDRGGQSLRLPAYGGPGRAVLTVTPTGATGADPLSPGTDDLSFGARFRLDAAPDPSEPSSSTDNGDNLVQRGLYSDGAQFKLQLDKGVPSCRIAGSEGAVFVTADAPVERGVWQQVTCTRRGDEVVLEVQAPDGTVTGSGATGPIGAVDFPAGSALTVGGKVSPEGEALPGNSDQFNGTIDDVVVSGARP